MSSSLAFVILADYDFCRGSRTHTQNLCCNQIVLRWALQVGIVPLVGPSQRVHMEEDVRVSKAFLQTRKAASCNQNGHNSAMNTCENGAVRRLTMFEIQHLHDIQNITKRQRQRPMLLGKDKTVESTRKAQHKLPLVLLSDDHEV